MPELPEVETIASQLCASNLTGKEIVKVSVLWPATVVGITPETLKRNLKGKSIIAIERYGKWMIFKLSSGKSAMVHLRMSGHFHMSENNSAHDKYDRIVLQFEDSSALHFSDVRKFGRWQLVNNPEEITNRLGPDALTDDFTLKYFSKQLSSRRRVLKPLLLDQSILAGLGNIYVDEALWLSGLHPQRISDSLKLEEIKKLRRAIRQVLRAGVRNGGTSLGSGRSNYVDLDGHIGGHRGRLNVYARTGDKCTRCKKTEIVKTTVAQRGTHFCPVCQPML